MYIKKFRERGIASRSKIERINSRTKLSINCIRHLWFYILSFDHTYCAVTNWTQHGYDETLSISTHNAVIEMSDEHFLVYYY